MKTPYNNGNSDMHSRELIPNMTKRNEGLYDMVREENLALKAFITGLNHCPECFKELKAPEGRFGGYGSDLCECDNPQSMSEESR